MCSRILGLIREIVLAALFAGENRRWLDCFTMAFRTPNMLRDLFAEGALSTAFVTTFSQKIQDEGEDSAWRLAQKMATLTAIFMSLIAVLGILLAPWIITLLAYGWKDTSPEKIEFTITLARIMYPFIALVSLSALVMGMLNSRGVFAIPALASSFFNLGSIITGGLIGYYLDPNFGKVSLIGFAIGTLAGGLCQLGFQLPALFKAGYRLIFDFNWRDSGVAKILRLMYPAVIAGSAVQVNVLLNSIFASYLSEDGSVSWLSMAFRLMQLPIGIFGVAVATVTLPAVSRLASKGITPEFRSTLSNGLRTALALTIPAALGLFLLASPIISVIFERGRFNSFDTSMTAGALRYYAIGLAFYAGIKVIQPAFYAIDKRFIPMLVSLLSILVNAALNWYFVFVLQKDHRFLALSTGLVAALNFSILFFCMRHYAQGFELKKLLTSLGKIAICSVLMTAVCLLSTKTLLANWESLSYLSRCFSLLSTIAVAATLYFGAAYLLKVKELNTFIRAMIKR